MHIFLAFILFSIVYFLFCGSIGARIQIIIQIIKLIIRFIIGINGKILLKNMQMKVIVYDKMPQKKGVVACAPPAIDFRGIRIIRYIIESRKL